MFALRCPQCGVTYHSAGMSSDNALCLECLWAEVPVTYAIRTECDFCQQHTDCRYLEDSYGMPVLSICSECDAQHS